MQPRLNVYRPGAWLPSEHKAHREFVKRIAVTVDELELTSPSASSCSDEEEYQHMEYASHKAGLTPALQELEQLIENDAKLFMLFTQMFSETPNTPPYWCDPTGQKQIRDYKHLFGGVELHRATTTRMERCSGECRFAWRTNVCYFELSHGHCKVFGRLTA